MGAYGGGSGDRQCRIQRCEFGRWAGV